MRDNTEGVNINILGKEFLVACQKNERESLTAAASYLDKRMKEVQKSGRVIGAERCAIMAALNITNDLLEIKTSTGGNPKEIGKKLRFLQSKIEAVLQQ